ncbi:putative aarF domain-containing protein kinase [Monoraphidium neglectum]|uniref:Putative aarF domain-containing protein kinase n=1 Tax=Monoraphidium neglectum TaxID=145388 RepID=A0A0D2K9G7_9CHLO|nr:putative aarF domain-containing protein kinase [Monoraphidium neglectum]KIZ06883.1 putative aarF domain-containing protein kinase [Monoraphidium neglectum]|eukprot:XP_013905902.1 putative aarF domain-containing protein kinase [Monoraphidium neglectum]
MGELEGLGRDYPFSIPPFFALILRAFSVIEGIALKVDPDYAIVQECFPYITRRLLSDDDPRMRAALRDVLYGGRQRLDLERLVRLADGFSAFTTDGLDMDAAAGVPALVQQQQQQQQQPEQQQLQLQQRQQVQQQQGVGQQRPALDPAARDALLLVFSEKGGYVQELIVEEVAAAVDALSASAAQQLLASFLASPPAAAALLRLERLGPLRPLLLPLPTPLELLGRVAPTITLSEEDQEALSVVRGALQIAQRLQAAQPPPSAAGGASAAAAAQRRGARAAGDAVFGAARTCSYARCCGAPRGAPAA